LTPSEAITKEKAVSYTDQLRGRLVEIQAQLKQLDSDFKTGNITGDDYVAKRQILSR
jgi:hypothetical protein